MDVPDSVITKKPSLSSLGLQMSLYYNSFLSVIFIIIMGTCTVQKAALYKRYVPVVAVGLYLVVEPYRLYFGFSGNLREKVPDLATYLLMTVFPQVPIVIYLGYLQSVTYPVDAIMGTLVLIFLIVQFYCGVKTMQRLIRMQTSQFLRSCDE
jgi:transmembrane protein 17